MFSKGKRHVSDLEITGQLSGLEIGSEEIDVSFCILLYFLFFFAGPWKVVSERASVHTLSFSQNPAWDPKASLSGLQSRP